MARTVWCFEVYTYAERHHDKFKATVTAAKCTRLKPAMCSGGTAEIHRKMTLGSMGPEEGGGGEEKCRGIL